LYNLDRVMEGDLNEIIEALKLDAQQTRMVDE
jgi:protein subunit release factor A